MYEHEVKIKHNRVRGTVTSSCIQVSGTSRTQLYIQNAVVDAVFALSVGTILNSFEPIL